MAKHTQHTVKPVKKFTIPMRAIMGMEPRERALFVVSRNAYEPAKAVKTVDEKIIDAVQKSLNDEFYMMPDWLRKDIAKEALEACNANIDALPQSIRKSADTTTDGRAKAAKAIAHRIGQEKAWPVKRKTTVGDLI